MEGVVIGCGREALAKAGIGALVVREVPALLGELDVEGLLRDLADELASSLGMRRINGELTAEENATAQELAAQRYASDSFTHRR